MFNIFFKSRKNWEKSNFFLTSIKLLTKLWHNHRRIIMKSSEMVFELY